VARREVYNQDFTPISGSLGLSAIFAALPIMTLFVLLGGLKMKSKWAALVALGVAMAVAVIVYGMPVSQATLAAL
jgi:lactate permease